MTTKMVAQPVCVHRTFTGQLGGATANQGAYMLWVVGLLPLAVGTPPAALRLNELQGDRAHMVLSGRRYLTEPRLTKPRIRKSSHGLGLATALVAGSFSS